MTAATPYLLIRLDLIPGAVTDAQRLLRPIEAGGSRELLSEGLTHALQYASGYRLYLCEDGTEAPKPAVAPMSIERSPFTSTMRRSAKS
jgi:hypothetical protein